MTRDIEFKMADVEDMETETTIPEKKSKMSSKSSDMEVDFQKDKGNTAGTTRKKPSKGFELPW